MSRQLLEALARLYRIIEAGEKGYAVAAINVSNRGLKILFKARAQQRARFKAELGEFIQKMGGRLQHHRGSLLGMLHRGRMDIMAALSIREEEREQKMLTEVLLGETFALRVYERTLKRELPTDLRVLLTKQYAEVHQAKEQIHLMRSKDRVRLLVRLFDSLADANLAIQDMSKAGLHLEVVTQTPIHEVGDLYSGRGSTLRETLFSGGVGGAWWGGLMGFLAGWSAEYASQLTLNSATAHGIWAWITLLGCAAGAFVGALLGLFVGMGLAEEDQYIYEQSLQHGQILLFVRVEASQAWLASQLMAQINRRARIRSATVPV